jgi:DNA primase
MSQESNPYERAARYHEALPDRIRQYLNQRGIPDTLIDLHVLGWNGRRITIPIFNSKGELAFFKLAKDPEDQSSSPKMIAPRGSDVELYGWEEVKRKPRYIIICEGEFDRLVLEAQGFIAVTSTGGAGSFREEWAPYFRRIPHVYICYDRDEAGQRGAMKIGQMIPHAKLIELLQEVGDGGDITDFFVRLGRSREDFVQLIGQAKPVPPQPAQESHQPWPKTDTTPSPLRQRIDRIKRDVAIAEVVSRSVELRASGSYLIGLCPFHEDRNPSLAVYPHTNTFYCYGCQKHGDVITFVREREHFGFGQALDVLDSLRRYHGREPHADN